MMRRFFYHQPDCPLQVGETLPITDEIFHHWCRVLRGKLGEQAIFFDGNGGEYQVMLTQIDKKTAFVKIEQYFAVNRNLPFWVDIGLVISRGERMDYAIQKATEMGVHCIHLLYSQHGEVRLKHEQISKKLAHWQQVAISACEQSGLNLVPKILPPMELQTWLQTDLFFQSSSLKLVLAVPMDDHDPSTNVTVYQNIQQYLHQDLPKKHLYLLIGAEGGLSAQELTAAMSHNFLPWQIGDRVLRTETAPVVALSALQVLSMKFHE